MDIKNSIQISNAIYQYLSDNKITQIELAKKIGCSKVALNGWLKLKVETIRDTYYRKLFPFIKAYLPANMQDFEKDMVAVEKNIVSLPVEFVKLLDSYNALNDEPSKRAVATMKIEELIKRLSDLKQI